MAAKRRRKGRYSFLLGLFAVIAGLILFVIMSGLFFKISNIRVDGVSVYRESDVAGKTGFTLGENIFLINKVNAIRAIRAAFPYVDSVKIRRELPGTVVVIIREKAPAVMIESGGYYWLMDTEGMLLESVSVPLAPTSLPAATGVTLLAPVAGTAASFGQAEQDKLSVLLELLEVMLDTDVWHDVDWIDLDQISNPCFGYLDRFTVEIGTPEHIEHKLKFMLAFSQDRPTVRGTLDLGSAYDKNEIRFRME